MDEMYIMPPLDTSNMKSICANNWEQKQQRHNHFVLELEISLSSKHKLCPHNT